MVDLSPRAWAPVFASLEDVLGRSGHVPTRHVYERAGFTRLPIARYFKKL